MSERDPWHVEFEPRAARDLRRLDPPVARRVLAALDRLLERDPSVDLRRLRGSDEWRVRVGDWRVRLQLDFDAQGGDRRPNPPARPGVRSLTR